MSAPATALEGGITLRLIIAGGTLDRVAIESSRPVRSCEILHGRPLHAALPMLPRLFAVCGRAQSLAGLQAAERALGIAVADPHRQARRLLLLAETVAEHAWRILIDWPQARAMETEAKVVAQVRAAAGAIGRALYPRDDALTPGGGRLQPDHAALADAVATIDDLLRTHVFSPDWAAMAFDAWRAEGATIPARFLGGLDEPALGAGPVDFLGDIDEAEMDRRLAADDEGAFVARPLWAGRPRITGPLERQRSHPVVADLMTRHGNGVLALFAARLFELAAQPAIMAQLARSIAESVGKVQGGVEDGAGAEHGSGTGLATVDAARGRLIHRMEVERGIVKRYQVLAPTEWNFHPDGALACGLAGLPADDGLADAAALVLAALDPCVAYSVTTDHSDNT